MIKKNISKKQSQSSIQKTKLKNKEVGKPVGINQAKTSLKSPNIWTSLTVERQLISYLVKIGRHLCLHQSGKRKNVQNNSKMNNNNESYENFEPIQQDKSTYYCLELIARSLFSWKCTKLNVVYFFRNNQNFKLEYQKLYLRNEKWNSIIKNIKFLLNEEFYNEFIGILKMFEDNYSTQGIVDFLISQSKKLDQVPQLVQNFFILLCKEKKIPFQIKEATCTALENLKQAYLDSLKDQKYYLCEIIEQIRAIMYQDQINENCFYIEEDLDENYINFNEQQSLNYPY